MDFQGPMVHNNEVFCGRIFTQSVQALNVWMKHSSNGETQQEAYEFLQIDLAFADKMLNYTFFVSLVLKASNSDMGYVKVFFLVSQVLFSLLRSSSYSS